MEEARRTLMDAMRQVETSSTAKEEMGKALMEDLKQAMGQMRTAGEYKSSGHAVLRSKKMAHKSQRCYENDSATSRLYSTPCQASACAAMSAPAASSAAPASSGLVPSLSSLRIGVRRGAHPPLPPGETEDAGEEEVTEELHERVSRLSKSRSGVSGASSGGLLSGGLNMLKSLVPSRSMKTKGKASKP
eukprot:CAMPEP_0113706270 /NCGR_PEP_ID=MMETSP0038_2-20120614/27624_1 /TAXON_ID=2898 /ORGANISM="Cryptomonas paramecium" /LENGTH=188 /DNA_ID=CAMNT_0000631429 /DNA_START=323 /DNA_END=889 /DNA_ORIENTATION=- /assembly_acc=CAM_ASM_000170